MISFPLHLRHVIPALLLASHSPLAAQSVQDKIGYTQLVAELGGAPGGGTTTTYLRAMDSAWRYRKGTSEASAPTDAWRLNGFIEDASWMTGQTSVGYGDGDDQTILTDMQGPFGYLSVYLRHPFTVAAGKIPSRLLLRLYCDDGAIIWINGIEVARVRAGSGFRAYNAAATGAVNDASWEEFRLENAASYLLPGTNTLAIHAFNQSLASSDFSIDAELLMPPVTQVESLDDRFDSIEKYLPLASPNPSPATGYQFTQVGGDYDATTVEVRSFPSGIGYGQSPHAGNVALRFYHNTNSVAPDIERVRSFESNDWLNAGSLQTDLTIAPNVEESFTQNHSWIASDSVGNRTAYNRALRRYDFASARDNFLPVVGVNYWFPQDANPPAVPPLLSTAYHVLSVGLSDGRHSQGGTVGGYDGVGRIKPEIVAPETAPSYSTAITASSVALLMELANLNPALNSAMNIEVMKAIVLAGATKEEFPGWSRTTTRPIDSIYGAGELNVRHSYRILSGGEQPATPGTPVAFRGWDFDFLSAAAPKAYTFVVEPNARLVQFSAFLTWHRQFAASPWTNDFSTAPTLPNLELRLYMATNGTPNALVDSSVSTIDNLEHIYQLELPAGEYLLQASSNTLSDFGIAWRSDPEALPPEFALSNGGVGITVDLASLVTGIDYTVQRSTDLANWVKVQTITATGPTASYIDLAGDPRAYYRIKWNLWK